jgi:hypothetical protein
MAAKRKRKISFDTNLKSSILKTIALEVALARGVADDPDPPVDVYAKGPDPGSGGYGKSDPDSGVVFGKSDPPKRVDTVINVGDRAQVLAQIKTITEKIKSGKIGTISR